MGTHGGGRQLAKLALTPQLHGAGAFMGRNKRSKEKPCHELRLHAGCRSRAAQPQKNSRGWVLAQHWGRMRRAGSERSHGADHGAGVPARSPDPHRSPQSREQQGLQEGLGRVEVNMKVAEGSLKWHRRLLPCGRAGRAAPSPLSSPRGHPRGSGAGCPPPRQHPLPLGQGAAAPGMWPAADPLLSCPTSSREAMGSSSFCSVHGCAPQP